MGHRVTQKIFECAICGDTPDDGEYLWEMGGEYWCESCCNKDDEETEDTNDDVHCQVCGYYCFGKGGAGCIDKPKLCGYEK